MKPFPLALALVTLCTGQALAFGLVLHGEGSLALDSDKLHDVSQYDYDGDGTADLIRESFNLIEVLDLAGNSTWSATIDTLEICPECVNGGYWGFYFKGFFEIEPGQRDAIVTWDYWEDFYSNRGLLVISTADGSIRHHLEGRGLDAGVDLDGDEIHELVCYGPSDGMTSLWEVWGNQTPSSTPPAIQPGLRVNQNHPNPFNPATTVYFELARPAATRVEIYDVAGRLVHSHPMGELTAGTHEFVWHGSDRRGNPLASGTYFYSVVAGDERQARKMMLLK